MEGLAIVQIQVQHTIAEHTAMVLDYALFAEETDLQRTHIPHKNNVVRVVMVMVVVSIALVQANVLDAAGVDICKNVSINLNKTLKI